MGVASLQRLPCPACGALVVALIADTINPGRAPWMRAALLEGALHRVRCVRCPEIFLVEKPLVYTDFERRQWVAVCPPTDQALHRERAVVAREAFDAAMRERAPAALRRFAEGFTVRLVFGLQALREKVLAWEHGLDDGVLELLKLDLLADRPGLAEAGVATLRLTNLQPDGTLGFAPVFGRPPSASVKGLWVPRALYDEEHAALPRLADAHHELLAGPYVDVLRFL